MFHLFIWTFDTLCNPVTWILGLVVVGGLSRGRPFAQPAVLAGAGLLLVLSAEPVSNRLLYGLEHRVPSSVKPGVRYDALILLGGALEHGATQSEGAPYYDDDADRVTTAFELLRSGAARDVVVTGGKVGVGDEVVEAEITGKVLERWGIEPARIVLATDSRNTAEDAAEAKRIVGERGYRSVLLLTSARHMPRAVDRFRAAGLAFDTLSTDFRAAGGGVRSSFIPRAEYLADSADVIREVVGAWLQRLRD